MLNEMVNIVATCFGDPRRPAIWSPALRKYVCPTSQEGAQAIAEDAKLQASVPTVAVVIRPPPIDTQFKLVFVTATIGTFFFIIVCVVTTIAAGKSPPELLTELVRAMADLAKIGFGAIVGLLGGKSLKGGSQSQGQPSGELVG